MKMVIMKKCIVLLLILSTMVLVACQQPGQQTTGAGTSPNHQTTAPTTTQSATTQPVPTTQPVLTTQPFPSTPAEELAVFNALFGEMGSWYNKALLCQYTAPGQIKLGWLFYNGFPGESREPTDTEWAQLKDQPGFDINYDLIRMPVDQMDQVLTEIFGITTKEIDDVGFEGLVFLESTNCYYCMRTDFAAVENFDTVAVETQEDGSICVYYTANYNDSVYVVTLMPNGDGYQILSNMRVE